MDAASAAQLARFPKLAKYELLEELGHGGMATVYRALDRRLGREVAVKVIHPHLRDSAEVVSRFNTEARAVAKLRHPNIVEVFDVSDADEPEQYLVVELLRGTTLRKLLLRHQAFPAEVAAALALDLLGALAHAHSLGVVHRDVKPENVLIDLRPASSQGQGGGAVVKLTDFGIAKLLDAQGVTSTGQVLGSPAHMAPEQIEGGEVDARADVFGLGVLFYECMVGHLPFEGANPAQVLRRVLEGQYAEAQKERPVVGNRWSAVADRALARAAEDRFSDATAMRDAIDAELARLGIADPCGELAAFLEDPPGYLPAHNARMIERLCALGNEERKARNVLAAAGDYSRALAHSPDDPHLLRIVVAMHRAEARGRWIRRVGAGLGAGAVVAAGAVGLARQLRSAGPSSREPLAAANSPRAGASTILAAAPSGVSEPPPAAAASAETRRAPPIPAVPVVVPAAAAAHSAAASRIVERSITLDLSQAMGLSLAVDADSARTVRTGWKLPLDTKAHLLTFSCDVCTTVTRPVPAGENDETISVNVPIKPATLNVQGDGNKTYQVVEDPQLAIRAGANLVPLNGQFRAITVRQLETDVRVHVRLEAGKAASAVF